MSTVRWQATESFHEKLNTREGEKETTEMKMLKRIKGVTLFDKIRNEDTRKKCKTPSIVEVIKKQRLRWFGHVYRSNEQLRPDKVSRKTRVDGNREGKTKTTMERPSKIDMLSEGLKSKTHLTD